MRQLRDATRGPTRDGASPVDPPATRGRGVGLPFLLCQVVAAVAAVSGCGGDAPRPTATAPAAADVAAAAPATRPRGASPASGLRDITFDDIKLGLEKGAAFSPDHLTPRVHELAGTRVRIRGYILPSFQQRGLAQFVLVRDNQECCFGPGAALHDCIVVRMEPGKTAEFSIRPVAVTGGFRVEELRGPDGNHLAIYAIDGENVQ